MMSIVRGSGGDEWNRGHEVLRSVQGRVRRDQSDLLQNNWVQYGAERISHPRLRYFRDNDVRQVRWCLAEGGVCMEVS
jgi:hypothetical protein